MGAVTDSRPGTPSEEQIDFRLCLYISGLTPRSATAISRVRDACEQYLKGRYHLDVIDIYQQPRDASNGGILATPTLVRMHPLPVMKAIVDVERAPDVLASIGIEPGTIIRS